MEGNSKFSNTYSEHWESRWNLSHMHLLLGGWDGVGGYLINFLFKYDSFPNMSVDENRCYIETL